MKRGLINNIILGDALKVMREIDSDSIDLVLTDPPYFLDKLDNEWKHKKVSSKKHQQVVKSLPSGMKFDRNQGLKFYEWYLKISEELFRILKPGGFFFSFSSPRLYHRMASAADDAGFEIRDCFLWVYTQNQMKAMSMNHFIEKQKIPRKAKDALKQKLDGWKTPQIRSCFEPILMAQKPTNGTFLKNMAENEVGMFNLKVRVGDNMYPANILSVEGVSGMLEKHFLIKKPNKKEKGKSNGHLTVKPLELCEHIINLSTYSKKAIVLDPFVGSGTTAVAARDLGKRYIGIDINPEYIKIANDRLGKRPA